MLASSSAIVLSTWSGAADPPCRSGLGRVVFLGPVRGLLRGFLLFGRSKRGHRAQGKTNGYEMMQHRSSGHQANPWLLEHEYDARQDSLGRSIDAEAVEADVFVVDVDHENRRQPPVETECSDVHLAARDVSVGQVEMRPSCPDLQRTPATLVDRPREDILNLVEIGE